TQNQYGQISFSNLQTFLEGKVSTYTFAPGQTPLSWRSLESAVFAEDTIRVTPAFELRVGFRGEFTNGWNEAQGRASNYLFDSNGVILTRPAVGGYSFTDNRAKFLPSPRVGLAWSLIASMEAYVHGRFGIYLALLN